MAPREPVPLKAHHQKINSSTEKNKMSSKVNFIFFVGGLLKAHVQKFHIEISNLCKKAVLKGNLSPFKTAFSHKVTNNKKKSRFVRGPTAFFRSACGPSWSEMQL